MTRMNTGKNGFNVYDVLLLVGVHSRTGEVVIESGNNIGSILVHDGTVLHAFSPYSRAIGDLLVEDGVITETELLDALELQKKKTHIPIGTLLLQTGKVRFELIERLVQEQIRKAIGDFAGWENIQFSYIQKDVTPFDRIGIRTMEFISPDVVKQALLFLGAPTAASPVPPPLRFTSLK